MARNGSGTMTPSVDFTTEAASPPIEIAKLDTVLDDMAAELTNSIAADGQTNPSADLKMNGFKHTNVGAATALNHYARVSELIDQDHIYYVDSGSANTYAITPSPAIAAYEEGQKFSFRAANANSGASTLNVNALGAFAIQHPDGSAMQSGAIVAGGIYEVTYDANTTPDRWVLTSPASEIADGMLSSNVPMKNATNTFTATGLGLSTSALVVSAASPWIVINETDQGADAKRWYFGSSGSTLSFGTLNDAESGGADWLTVSRAGASVGTIGLVASTLSFTGVVSTPNTSASEVGYKGTPQNVQNGNYGFVLTDAGCSVDKQSGGAGETFTIPANGSVAFPVGTVICGDNDGGGTLTIAITTDTLEDTSGNTGSRTVADNGQWVIKKIAATKWRISGIGVS